MHCGKFQDALEPLLSWLRDTEELVANQKPPSAEYRVVKAQIQEQKVQAGLKIIHTTHIAVIQDTFTFSFPDPPTHTHLNRHMHTQTRTHTLSVNFPGSQPVSRVDALPVQTHRHGSCLLFSRTHKLFPLYQHILPVFVLIKVPQFQSLINHKCL